MVSDHEVRAVIKFLNAEGTRLKIHRRLSNVHVAGNVTSLRHIYKWIKCFNTGWSDTHYKWIKSYSCFLTVD